MVLPTSSKGSGGGGSGLIATVHAYAGAGAGATACGGALRAKAPPICGDAKLQLARQQPWAVNPSRVQRWRGLAERWKIPLILAYYSLCSSTLIVINKVAVHTTPAPVFILLTQLLFSAAVVRGASAARVVEAEPLRWVTVRPFLLIVVAFLGTLFANMKVLAFSNVETFITFRSSTPLVLSLFDYLLLGRELPGGRSIFSLVLLVASCAGYTMFDQGFKVQAYMWLCVWYCFFCFEACYVKHVCDTVKMSNWGRVYYTNVLSGAVLALVFPFCSAEHAVVREVASSTPRLLLLGLSCLVGLCMSHAGYLLRSNVSATAGVVVGVVCKLGSVAINLAIWDQHASPVQLAFLVLGLAGGGLFRQAPLRASARPPAPLISVGVIAGGDKLSRLVGGIGGGLGGGIGGGGGDPEEGEGLIKAYSLQQHAADAADAAAAAAAHKGFRTLPA